MATATQEQPARNAIVEHAVEFTPLGESDPVKLTHNMVLAYCVSPTRSGAMPSKRDVTNFIMLCKARRLNPFVGDAFLVGYDSQQEGAKFSLITAHQALLKRAEAEQAFDGLEAGIIVFDADKNIAHRKGAMRMPGDKIIGAWATVYRKDRSHPTEVTVEFEPYNTNRSRWKIDPAGMIVKVAKDAGLREAFPSTLGGMYGEEEMDAVRQGKATDVPLPNGSSRLSALTERLSQPASAAVVAAAEPDDESFQDSPPDDAHFVVEESEASE